MAYLDFDEAENERVNKQVEEELKARRFTTYRGPDYVWKAAARDYEDQQRVHRTRNRRIALSLSWTCPAILTPIVSEFEEVAGKTSRFIPFDAAPCKSFLPETLADEMLENHFFIEEPGYHAGRDLRESLDLLESVGLKPTSWKDFLTANKDAFQ
ncbi:hypothetical protein DER46DRAFT_663177 [Fusarium sp. MPI-SDFR-AT-0072]|nr:hypothetical protein DER46DRAFT_663177 [Fusarium sp. MPI-SDFR-AT-0072]